MEAKNASVILSSLHYQCPFCNKSTRLKPVLRKHLKREHTDWEADKYIKNYKKKEDFYFDEENRFITIG